MDSNAAPVQPVEKPILCSPYVEPNDHWVYDKETGEARRAGTRRPAGYWYKTEKTGSAQQRLFAEEERDDLPLVNLLREDAATSRCEAGYRGASNVTRDLLNWWAREDRTRRLFFCQREAVETMILSRRTPYARPIQPDRLPAVLPVRRRPGEAASGERPGFDLTQTDFAPSLVDRPFDDGLLLLRRLGLQDGNRFPARPSSWPW